MVENSLTDQQRKGGEEKSSLSKNLSINVQKSMSNLIHQLSPHYNATNNKIAPVPNPNPVQKKVNRHIHGYGSFAPAGGTADGNSAL